MYGLLSAPPALAGLYLPARAGGLIFFGCFCLLLGALLALVLARWRGSVRAGKAAAPSETTLPPATVPDAVPAQLVVLDFSRVREELQRLRDTGLQEIREKIAGEPALVEKWFALVRVVTANRRAVEENDLGSIAEFVTGYGSQKWEPFGKLFPAQLQALWVCRRSGEEEFGYTDRRRQPRACYTRFEVADLDGVADWSRVTVLVVDTTAAPRTAEATLEKQELMRTILGRANIILWWARVQRDGEHLRWQINTPKLTYDAPLYKIARGIEKEALWDYQQLPDRDKMDALSMAAIKEGRAGYQQEYRVLGEGETYWVNEEVVIQRITDDEWSLVGVVVDITQRQKAEEARQRAAVQTRQILERVDCMIWEARVTQSGPGEKLQWMFDVPPSGLQKRIFGAVAGIKTARIYENLHVPQLPEMNIKGTRALLRGDAGYEQEFQIVKPDGQSFWLHEQVAVSSNQPGCWDLVGVTIDVTERRRLEEQMQRATKMESVGLLAGGIAHDFNNILTAILGNITLAKMDLKGAGEVERILDEAQRATARAKDLTQQLLTFAKGGDPVRASLLLPQIVSDAASFALHGSRLKCELDIPADLWPANADKGQISQVVQNLVLNAVQAMADGGSLRIVARNHTQAAGDAPMLAPGDYVRIAVVDTGAGIAPGNLAKIFDPYFTTKDFGHGLGLATVYSIVKKHQGHVEVESEPGRGTTFTVWLPASHERPSASEGNTSPAFIPLKGRVLFMDDDETIQRMAAKIISRLGPEVDLAQDGRQAVQMYKDALAAGKRYNLVIMDLTIPGGMGGKEAIAMLRTIDPAVQAIVSSGYSSDPVLADFRAHGFSGMVAKPYDIKELIRTLQQFLGVNT
jgi:signal transduction histidine kinase/ActR/RegA family two-component response regulator